MQLLLLPESRPYLGHLAWMLQNGCVPRSQRARGAHRGRSQTRAGQLQSPGVDASKSVHRRARSGLGPNRPVVHGSFSHPSPSPHPHIIIFFTNPIQKSSAHIPACCLRPVSIADHDQPSGSVSTTGVVQLQSSLRAALPPPFTPCGSSSVPRASLPPAGLDAESPAAPWGSRPTPPPLTSTSASLTTSSPRSSVTTSSPSQRLSSGLPGLRCRHGPSTILFRHHSPWFLRHRSAPGCHAVS